MAKKAKSKSQAIRDYLAANPNKSTSEIAEAVKVTPALVYNVKAAMKGKAGSPKRKRASSKKSVRRISKEVRTPREKPSGYSIVIEAARFVQSCGGIEEAQNAIKAVEEVATAMKA